jgi:adenine-specific DNA methylase
MFRNPTLTAEIVDDHRKPFARYGAMMSALRKRLAPAQLHHRVGHDPPSHIGDAYNQSLSRAEAERDRRHSFILRRARWRHALASRDGGKISIGRAVKTSRASVIDRSYVQVEGKADRLGQRLMAIVAEGPRGRIYLSPNDAQEATARQAQDEPIVDEAKSTFLSPTTPTRAMITGGVCSAYGLRTYGHLFTARQIVALTTFSDLVSEARVHILGAALSAGLADDNTPLHAGGLGAAAYADAIATYLGFASDRRLGAGSVTEN